MVNSETMYLDDSPFLDVRAEDLDFTRRMWVIAANLGDPDAMKQLGVLAEWEGDLDAAGEWYGQAAYLGNEEAARLLAELNASRN